MVAGVILRLMVILLNFYLLYNRCKLFKLKVDKMIPVVRSQYTGEPVPVAINESRLDEQVDQAAQGIFCGWIIDVKSKKFQAVVITAALLLVLFLVSNPIGWMTTTVKIGIALSIVLANVVIYYSRKDQPAPSASVANSPLMRPRFSDPPESPRSEEQDTREEFADQFLTPRMPVAPQRRSRYWGETHQPSRHTFVPAEENITLKDVSPNLTNRIPPKSGWSSRARVAKRVVQELPLMFSEERYNQLVADGRIIRGEDPEE
jgi:hypothetical protein